MMALIVEPGFFLVFGVSLALLKGGDLLLRESQKAAFQRWMEDLTLWLDYQRPFVLLTRLELVQRRHLAFSGLLWLLTTTLLLRYGRARPVIALGMGMLLATVIWGQAWLLWPYKSRALAVLKGTDLRQLLIRSCGVIALAVAWPLMFFALERGAALYLPLGGQWALAGCELVLGVGLMFHRFYGLLQTLSAVSMLVMLTSALLLVLNGVLYVVRAVSWRIVEYSKGAWGAVVILATAACSLALALYGAR